ncbi:TetR family transcriptional regulator [Allokutzneria sp. A3M-2-11 16]|uniref:TetR/AcrR family transcriptional regulator n=1 Tax=Allokutzneria sp. A3M-2-11 16 TaxID=2962043 RepID=UPI0020B8DB1F|nr:TetR/AcrR family transcriptional regulator [Allokutzneria sp. A3M-2-11 16]MCP3803753.1 TetR family transcriptional regulator [Allokutzneria sp. A3M-2-11 16]
MTRTADDTFIHVARRKQLVGCAIEVIAEHGLANASTVRIAERAGVSRGVLTYHFRDRAELIEQVVQQVYALGAETIGPKMVLARSPRESLLTFIRGSVELYADHPRHMLALTEIFAGNRSDDSRHQREISDLARILRAGQELGQFRAFDVDVMCRTIRGALDGALSHVLDGGEVEPYTAELLAIFDAATTSGQE